ncbi:hypothetical protein M0802_016366 [Mischocyttarus mexicanus]|nr:hypothetical protein M0802_016366 [Mischocyttarus mexicanus]
MNGGGKSKERLSMVERKRRDVTTAVTGGGRSKGRSIGVGVGVRVGVGVGKICVKMDVIECRTKLPLKELESDFRWLKLELDQPAE